MKGRVITAGGTYLIVAEVKTTQNSEENREANARLIAEAPALMALLQELMGIDDLDPRVWETGCSASWRYSDAMTAARALIARIKGA